MVELPANLTKEFVPHPPIEDEVADKSRYYHATTSSIRMIRPDGVGIVFVNHFCETDQTGTIDYLDTEIDKHKNIQIRRATDDEIRQLRWTKNPQQIAKEDILNDESVMEQLRREVEAKMRGEGWKPPEELRDHNKLSGVDANQGDHINLSSGAKVHLGSSGKVTPVSSKDLGGGAANSTNNSK